MLESFLCELIFRLAPGDWENPNPNDPDPEELENIWDLKNSSWLILGSTMSQGSDILPKYLHQFATTTFTLRMHSCLEDFHREWGFLCGGFSF